MRQEVQSEIPDRFTRVEAGTQIIKTGEKVAQRHIAMLQAMKNALAQARNLWAPLTILSSTLVALSLMIASVLYLHFFHRDLLKSLQKTTLCDGDLNHPSAWKKWLEHFLLHYNTNLIEVARFPLSPSFCCFAPL